MYICMCVCVYERVCASVHVCVCVCVCVDVYLKPLVDLFAFLLRFNEISLKKKNLGL